MIREVRPGGSANPSELRRRDGRACRFSVDLSSPTVAPAEHLTIDGFATRERLADAQGHHLLTQRDGEHDL